MSKAKRIFMYPEEGSSNLYLTSCRSVFEMDGSEVRSLPTSLAGLLKMLLYKEDVIILNWFEDRLGVASSQLFGFIKSTVALVLIRLIFRRVIWVRHNLKPHNKCSKRLYRWLLLLLNRLSDCQVTHRPMKGLDSHYIPHPLYPVDESDFQIKRDIPFLYFGVVKQYKGLDSLLEQWPVSAPLVMIGKCDDDMLAGQLNRIIETRSLNVQWRNEFIDYRELSSLIGRTEVVVLPHVDNSMVVSGAFYHAISLGANVLIRDGSFYQDYLINFDFVTSFKNENLMPVLSEFIAISPKVIKEEAEVRFSNEALSMAWREVFDGC